jgi:hypothetical protein
VFRRLEDREHRREADVGAFHERAPLLAGLRAEDLGELRLQCRPLGGVHLRSEGLRIESRLLHEERVELRLDGTDADVFAVGRLVGVVEVRATVEEIGAAVGREAALRGEGEEHRHEGGGTVDHGRVHDLPLSRTLGLEESADHAEREQHAAAAEVADQVQGRHGPLTGATDGVQGTRQADVVDVVARSLSHGSVLSPAGHAPVDEFRVAGEAVVGTEAETFGDARAEALEEAVGALDQAQHRFHALRVLEVHGDGATVPRQYVLRRRPSRRGTFDTDHLRAHVRKHHAAEGTGTDAREFDDPDTGKWTHGVPPSCRVLSR